MTVLLEDAFDGGVDGAPLREQLPQDAFAVAGQPVEALVALVLLAPLAHQQSLGLQAAQRRVEGAFVDAHAVGGQGLPEGVAVLLAAQLGQHRQAQGSPAQLQAEVLEDGAIHGLSCMPYRVRHIVYVIQYKQSRALRGEWDEIEVGLTWGQLRAASADPACSGSTNASCRPAARGTS